MFHSLQNEICVLQNNLIKSFQLYDASITIMHYTVIKFRLYLHFSIPGGKLHINYIMTSFQQTESANTMFNITEV